MDKSFRPLWLGLAAVAVVVALSTIGYVTLGFGVLDALYQTVITVTTVGFREMAPLSSVGKVFTMVVILAGTGTALYTFSVLLEALVQGHVRDVLGRRRMQRDIDKMHGHAVICGWGRVGRANATYMARAGQQVVVVDRDPDRIADVPFPSVLGDVTDDAVLRTAGIERARVLVAALEEDADNVYVVLSSRALRPDLFIIARARTDASEPKLARAGANRVVNPQRIGGERMAALALQPHVSEFLDVVMHDGTLEFRLEEITLGNGSSMAGRTLRESHIRDRTGALVLALREPGGPFTTNPPPETVICAGSILIAIGTADQLASLVRAAEGTA